MAVENKKPESVIPHHLVPEGKKLWGKKLEKRISHPINISFIAVKNKTLTKDGTE